MQNKYQAQNQDPKGNSREQPSILKTIDIVSSQLSFAERDKLTHLITRTEGQSNMTMLFDSVFQINTPNTQSTSISKKNKQRRHLLLARSKKKMQDDEEDEIVFTQNLSTAVRGYAISPKFFMKDDPTSFTSSFSFQSVEDKQSSQAEQDTQTFQFGTPENDNKKDSAGPRRRLTAKRRLKPTQMRINQPENITRIQNAGNPPKTGEQSVSTGITISTERNKLKSPTSRTSPKYDGSTLALGNGVAVGAVTKSNTENIDDNIPVLQPSLKRSKRKKDQAFSTNCDHEDMPSYIETERNSPNQQASREYSQKSHYSSQTRSRSILGAIDARMNAMGLGMRQTIQHSAIKYNHSQGRALSPSTLPMRDLDAHMNNDQKTAKSLASLSATYKHTASATNHSITDSHNHGPPQKDAWQQIIPLSRNLANEDKEQRQKFMNFWINLSDQQRRDLLKIDKEAVLRKIKEQQRRTCSCNVCGRRRSAVERELEMLYDAYCREIQTQSTNLERTTNRSSGSDNEENTLETENSEDLDIGKSLRVKGNLLTLDDDMIKHKGRKFLLLLDRLNSLERRLSSFAKIDDNNQAFESGQSESEIGTYNDGAMNKSKLDSEIDDDSAEHSDDNASDTNSEEDVGHDENPTDRDSDTEGEIDSDSDISLATEQRIKEGRKMFQMFAAKMFEQRAYAAFKEVMAFHNQQKLIQEEEDAVRQQQAKKDAKSKKAKQKKQRKKQQKQLVEQAKKQQEEEERQQLEQQKKLKEEQEKIERDRRRQVEEIQRKERDRLQAEKLQKIAQQKEKEKKKQQQKQEKEKNEISNNSLPTATQTKKKKKKKNIVEHNEANSETIVSTVQQSIVSKQHLKNQANKSKKTPSKLNPNAAPYTVGRAADKPILSNAPSSNVDDEDDDIANLLQNLIPAKLTLEDSASALGSSQDSWLLDEHADSMKMKFDHVASQNKTELDDETSQSSPDHNTASQWTTSEHVNIPSFLPVYSFPPAHVTNEQTWPQDTGVSLWTAKDIHPPNNHVNFAAWTPTWQGNLTGNSFTPSIVEKHFHFQPS